MFRLTTEYVFLPCDKIAVTKSNCYFIVLFRDLFFNSFSINISPMHIDFHVAHILYKKTILSFR